MRNILFFALSLALLGCNQEVPPNYTIVSGQVADASTPVNIYEQGEKRTLSISENGTFADTFDIEEAAYSSIRIGDVYSDIFLEPGNQLVVSLSGDTSLSFSGDNAAANSFLQKKSSIQSSLLQSFRSIFPLEEAEALAKLDSVKQEKAALIASADLPASFVALEKTGLNYDHQFNVSQYGSYRKYFVEGYEPTELITSVYSTTDYDNEKHAKLYPSLVDLASVLLGKEAEKLDTSLTDLEKTVLVLKDVESPSILHSQLVDALYFLNGDVEDLEAAKDALLKLAKFDKTKEEINDRYDLVNKLKAGNPSPSFDYENYAGGKTKLSDLKGKYVYVDVWATWCGPCIREIPSLKKLEEDFHDANIEFVSISIDEADDHGKWRKMIEDRELAGVQLFADNNWNSDFVTSYGIQGIPHFILIDPDGNIVSADAKRPSTSEIREQFKELGL